MLAVVRGLGAHEHVMVGDDFFKAGRGELKVRLVVERDLRINS